MYEYEAHFWSTHESDDYSCPHCSRKQTSEIIKSCSEYDYTSEDINALNDHIKKYHQVKTEESKNVFKCNFCEERFQIKRDV